MDLKLGDIVRLRVPHGTPKRSFRFGIVAEMLSALPDGSIEEVSLYLYEPTTKEILLGPNHIPEYVDFHTSEFELYKRASDDGYVSLVS